MINIIYKGIQRYMLQAKHRIMYFVLNVDT